MGEKNLIINHRKVSHHGLFRADELFAILNHALEERGYTKREKKSEELITPNGRLFQLELRPFKVVSHFATLMIKIHCTFDEVTETTKEVSGVKQKFEQGEVDILFDAWLLTDYENRRGVTPFKFFMKGVINKYIYNFSVDDQFQQQLAADTAFIYARVNEYLHTFQGKKIPPPREEEVRKKVEQEFLKKD